MRAHGVAEMEADARPLHLPAGEIEVGFAVLHGVFEARVVLRQLELDRRVAELGIVGKQFGQDLDDGFVVEYPLVAAAGGEPEPGPQGQVVAVAVLAHAGPSRLGDDAVEGLGAVAGLDLDGGVGADELVEVEVWAGGERLDAVFEQLVQVIAAVETQQRQRVRAEGRGEAPETLGLAQGGVHEKGLRGEWIKKICGECA
ncbi:hypothetical protein PAAM106076_18715 [Paracoccus aminovorans]